MPKKILIIEDDLEEIDLVKRALAKGGFEITVCESGRKAWEAIAQAKPDLIILDVMLSGIDCYSLSLKISQDAATKDIPVIILTALEPSKALFEKFSQVVRFMTKPFQPEDLLETVGKGLSRTLT